jgi:hypothetical protein
MTTITIEKEKNAEPFSKIYCAVAVIRRLTPNGQGSSFFSRITAAADGSKTSNEFSRKNRTVYTSEREKQLLIMDT